MFATVGTALGGHYGKFGHCSAAIYTWTPAFATASSQHAGGEALTSITCRPAGATGLNPASKVTRGGARWLRGSTVHVRCASYDLGKVGRRSTRCANIAHLTMRGARDAGNLRSPSCVRHVQQLHADARHLPTAIEVMRAADTWHLVGDHITDRLFMTHQGTSLT